MEKERQCTDSPSSHVVTVEGKTNEDLGGVGRDKSVCDEGREMNEGLTSTEYQSSR
jgi:hypothetical protein